MAQRNVLGNTAARRPLSIHLCRQPCQSRQTRVRCVTTETPSRQIQPSGNKVEKPQHQVLQNLRGHFYRAGILPNIGIIDALRSCYPDHTVTQTPFSTGLLDLAKSGQAKAILDISEDSYTSRIWNTDPDEVKLTGPWKDAVEFGKYDYQWNGHDFVVYAASYWHGDFFQNSFYILYPRISGDIQDGRSQIVDELIKTAAQEKPKVEDEIWVYDGGYWKKSRKLWESVSGCKWDDVILQKEVKHQLLHEIEGFFDQQRDYQSFAVPWKVRESHVLKTRDVHPSCVLDRKMLG